MTIHNPDASAGAPTFTSELTINITGRVIHGDHFGKTLGFPTANLDRRDYSRRRQKIKFGIYAGLVKLKVKSEKLKVFKVAVVLGPLDKRGLPKIEAHVIGFTGSLYGKKITLELLKFIRPFKKYKDVESLKKQISVDISNIKKILA